MAIFVWALDSIGVLAVAVPALASIQRCHCSLIEWRLLPGKWKLSQLLRGLYAPRDRAQTYTVTQLAWTEDGMTGLFSSEKFCKMLL
jgi:hypothetical protein